MTDLARLGLEIDSRQVKDGVGELDKLTAAGTRAEGAVDRLGDASRETGKDIRGAGRAATELAERAQRAAIAATGHASATDKVGGASRLAAHHVQNLTFQAQDLFVGLASGQRPMTVFLQQGTQIAGIMQQAGVGIGGLIKQVGGMIVGFARAHPILVGVAIAGAAVAGAFKLFQSEIEKSGELQKYAQGLGLTKKEMKELEGVGITAGDAFKGLYRTLDEYLGLSEVFASLKSFAVDAFTTALEWGQKAAAGIYAAFAGTFTAVKTIWDRFPSIMGDFATQAANAHIMAIEWMVNKAIAGLNLLARGANAVLASAGLDARLGQLDPVVFGKIANANAGAAAKAAADIGASYSSAFDRARGAMDGFFKRLGENTVAAAKDRLSGQAADIIGDRTEKAAKKAKEKTDEFLEGLEKARIEIDNFFRENDPVKKLTEEWERNSPADAIIKEIDRIRAVEIDWRETLKTDELRKAREEAEAFADSINNLINALSGLGKVGGAIGGLLGLFSGQTSSIGGPIGALLNTVTGTKHDAQGRTIALTLGDELRNIFGEKFGEKMLDVLQGAGGGILASQVFLGRNQSTTEQIGAALGGAAGKAIGTAIGGPIGGAIGSALGGIAGSLFGSLFNKTPKGSATIGTVNGALGVSSTSGNSKARIAAASKSAGAIIDGLESLADELGAELDPTKGSVSIGIRKKNFRVDPSGRGMTKIKNGAVDFGQDAEAAAYYAMLDLIKDGVLTGLRAGTETLLKNADDLEQGISKALKFEGVFKELAQLRDPLAFAIDEIGREGSRLRKIFDEAGASAAEYAGLEELLSRKRQDALEQERRRAVDKFTDRNALEVQLLELMGRSEDALAAARLNELASLEASLQPLQAMVYQLQDARAIIDQFGPLADDLKAFKQELLGGAGGTAGFATLQARFRETSALAKDGDAGALANLRGTATEFLDAAKANASSAVEYQRAVGEVLASVDQGIFAADSQIEYAQLQIDAVNNSANIIAGMREEMKAYQQQIVENTSYMARLWSRFEGDGLLIKTDTDTPLQVEVV